MTGQDISLAHIWHIVNLDEDCFLYGEWQGRRPAKNNPARDISAGRLWDITYDHMNICNTKWFIWNYLSWGMCWRKLKVWKCEPVHKCVGLHINWDGEVHNLAKASKHHHHWRWDDHFKNLPTQSSKHDQHQQQDLHPFSGHGEGCSTKHHFLVNHLPGVFYLLVFLFFVLFVLFFSLIAWRVCHSLKPSMT